MSNPVISVVITTRNRRDELNRALKTCFTQEGVSFEVLVYDDDSEDNTEAMVRREFPSVRFMRRNQRAGLIVRRNESFRDAESDYVVSLDDDAFFTDTMTLKRIVELFEHWPQTAAIALPFVEPNASPEASTMPQTPLGTALRSFSGGVSAIRRKVAIELGGFPELLVHQGEERDLCVRLLEHNWDIRYADTAAIVHLYSLNREPKRINYYGYRNTILFYWMRAPSPQWLFEALASTAKLFMHEFTVKSVPSRVHSLLAGWWGIIQFRNQRVPVSKTTWKQFRILPRHGPRSLCAQERDEYLRLASRLENNHPKPPASEAGS